MYQGGSVMKKVLGIVLLVLAFSLVSVPAFAQTAELSLKYWHAGVGGADLWVGDYQVGEFVYPDDLWLTASSVHPLNGGFDADYEFVFDTEKLVLQPSVGPGFILSGSYFLSPSTSVGISYWGLNRTDTVGVEFIDEYYSDDEYDDDNDVHYWLRVPWWRRSFSFYCPDDYDYPRWYYAGHYDFDGKGVLVAEGNLSMSALDIAGTKTLAGSGWEVGLSGGVRRAVFTQDQSTELELSGGYYDEDIEGIEYVCDGYSSAKWNLELDSRLSVSAIGPQVGIEGKYALGDKLILKAGAKAGILFGTATADATWSVDHWYYDEVIESGSLTPAQVDESPYEWVLYESMDVPYLAANPVQINTFDLSASLDYQITEQWSVEAGYYASLWKGVPSPCFFNYNCCQGCDPILYYDVKRVTWDQPEARDIAVSGLTVGVNFKF